MIQITKQPNTYAPSNNSIVWEFQTDNDETLYFNIIVKQTSNIQSSGADLILSKNKIYIPPLSNKSHIDISRVLDNLTSTQVTNSDNLIENLDGVISYYLEVKGVNAKGETTDETIYTDPFHAYNGAINLYQYLDFEARNFQLDKVNTFLTNSGTEIKLHHNNKLSLYFIADSTSGLAYFHRVVKLKDGTERISSIPFTNPIHKSLHRLQIHTRAIAEEYDVLISDVSSIQITGYNHNKQPATEDYKIYNVAYACKEKTINLHWENHVGGYDTYTFSNPKKSIQVEKQNIRTNQILSKSNGIYSSLERTVKVNRTVNYTVMSPKLSDQEFDNLANIIASKSVFIETLTGELIPVQITDNNIEVLQKAYTKQHNRLTISFSVPDDIPINTFTDVKDEGFDYVLDFSL